VSGRPYPIVQNQVQPPPFPQQSSCLKKIIMRGFSKFDNGDFQSLSMGFSKFEHGDFQSLSMGIFKVRAWGFSKFEHGDFQSLSIGIFKV